MKRIWFVVYILGDGGGGDGPVVVGGLGRDVLSVVERSYTNGDLDVIGVRGGRGHLFWRGE